MIHKRSFLYDTSDVKYWTVFIDVIISLLILFVFFMVYQFFENQDTLESLIVKSKQNEFLEVFNEEFSEEIDNGLVKHKEDGNIQRFSFGDSLLFDLGEYELNPGGKRILSRCLSVFNRFSQKKGKHNEVDVYKKIQVEGHTCDIPISRRKKLWRMGIRDNWSLSSLRAINVVKYFIDNSLINPKLFSGTGYSYFQGDKYNLEKNRKIEIAIIYSTETEKKKADN